MRRYPAFGLASLTALSLCGGAAAACLGHGAPVRLEGTLFFREYPGPPGYDQKSPPETVWFIALPGPVCVDQDPDLVAHPVNVAAKGLTELQVIPAYPPGASAFRDVRGKKVQLTGALHGRAGKEQKTLVVFTDARVELPAKRTGP